MKLYTIGYGGKKPEDFLNLLQNNGIKSVVDVRLRPDNCKQKCYVKAQSQDKGIESLLKTVGIEYFSLVELGNIFRNDEGWWQKYEQLLEKAGDLLIERLERVPKPFCLLCAEKEPVLCHRSLIAEYLEHKGYEAEHLVMTSKEERFSEKPRRQTKPRTYISSIRHFLNEDGELPDELPKPALKMAVFLTHIIASATEAFPNCDLPIPVKCNRKGCCEEIFVDFTDINKDIEWFCPECGDNGVISNWQGTKWDMTQKPPSKTGLN
jgi:hypothetical protein